MESDKCFVVTPLVAFFSAAYTRKLEILAFGALKCEIEL